MSKNTPIEATFEKWISPITAEKVASGSIQMEFIELDGDDIYWIEKRPNEGGRSVIIRRRKDGTIEDVIPSPYNVRSRVHEYGGRPYTVSKGIIYFINFDDQRLYIQEGNDVRACTDGRIRLADFFVVEEGIIAVAEDHTNAGVENFLALVNLKTGEVHKLACGQDFYAAPTLSPDGKKLAWLTWNHPHMPWDSTQLWTADYIKGSLTHTHCIKDDKNVSIFQPQWSPNETLTYVSDKNGWWNLFQNVGENAKIIFPIHAEFGRPLWILGMSTWGFIGSDIIAAFQEKGSWKIAYISPKESEIYLLPFEASNISSLRTNDHKAVFIADFPLDAQKVVSYDLATKKIEVIGGKALDPLISKEYYSQGEALTFPTEKGRMAHAFYYPPKNRDFILPSSLKPPLLVSAHGGPTAQTSCSFNSVIQFWTSRGYAFLDVNYTGSTGYGRAYRDALKGNWGLIDWKDCEAGARFLIDKGLVDPTKITIHGHSSGGYTTLCALTWDSLFCAGASYYGISDLALLAVETHKFEARYMDELVGELPACKDIYHDRSPLYHPHLLSKPIIFFQGMDDKVVPPNQAEMLFDILKKRNIPTELVLYEGEQHGFRQAKNIQDALEREYQFYLKVFGHPIGK